jgi:hypothetical protein
LINTPNHHLQTITASAQKLRKPKTGTQERNFQKKKIFLQKIARAPSKKT